MDEIPVGQLFSTIYLERDDKLVPDSKAFRNRFAYYIYQYFSQNKYRFNQYCKIETGDCYINSHYEEDYVELIGNIEIVRLLDLITMIWRFLKYDIFYDDDAEHFKNFVRRLFVEERLCYTLDEECGVHYAVDQEFEHNKSSTLKGLSNSRYNAVRIEFEKAYKFLDDSPPDYQKAVYTIFLSLEILTKLMVKTNNLNNYIVKNDLKQLALENLAHDDPSKAAFDKAFESFAIWVDGVHNYRHGQATTEPTVPPLCYAIYILSSGAAFLRLLLELDSIIVSETKS